MTEVASAYLDNYVKEDILSSLHVRTQLSQFGLISKDLERLEDCDRVLGLDVREEQRTLQWRHGTEVPEVPDVLFFFTYVAGSWDTYQSADGFG